MKRASVALTAAAIGVTSLAAAFVPASGATDRIHAIKFGVPRLVDPIHLYGEPDIKVAPNGTIYASGPQGTGVQRSIWNVSYDNGDSYRLIQDSKTGSAPSALVPTKSTLGPGGGDTEIAIDRHSHVYYSDLWALACYTSGYSADNGRTVQSTPAACSQPAADRQWLAIYDPAPRDHSRSPYKGPRPLVYMKYSDEGADGGSRVDYSTGNAPTNWHFGDPAGKIATSRPYGPTDAPVVVDQHTGDLLTLVMDGKNSMALAVGAPAKDGSAHLNFHYEHIADGLAGDPNTLFPGFAEDKARNLYAVWVDSATYQVWYSWARPNKAGTDWGRWSAPRRINSAPASTNLMPWIAAGGNGIVDVVWYGTDKTMAQLGPQGPSAQKHQAWWTWFSQISNAASGRPHIVQSRASQHPMHYNDICMQGTGCITQTGNRNLADFFEVDIDRQGRARIVYGDTSNGLSSVLGAVEAADHPGASVVTVATQQTGLNAWTGRPLKATESAAPKAVITDPQNDARYPVLGGAAVPGADISKITLARSSKVLRITVTLKHGTLGDAAAAAKAAYGRLVVRWQMGNTLYHAGVDVDAANANTSYYAGRTTTTDSCSVSACDPHTVDYVAPPLSGAVAATGSVKVAQNTTYTINVPLSAVGNPRARTVLEQVAGYVFAAPAPGGFSDSKPQSDADEVPLELEGTRAVNFEAAAARGGVLKGMALPVGLILLPAGALARRLRRRTTT